MHKNLVDALLPIGALIGALLLFGVFVWLGGVSPTETWLLLFKGAFGDWFSWQNTLTRSAPLMLTALCVALPARAGLVIIGGEGALVLGGLAAAAVPYLMPLPGNLIGTTVLCIAGFVIGGAWIALAGALRQYRGVNETISSLLLAYTAIAIFKQLVEGPMRDPATLNKPSTRTIEEALRIGGIGGSDVHWGFVIGVLACIPRLVANAHRTRLLRAGSGRQPAHCAARGFAGEWADFAGVRARWWVRWAGRCN